MGLFDRLFGKSRDKRFADFALNACDSRQTITIKIKEALPLVRAIEQALMQRKGLDKHTASRLASNAISLACPRCGDYNDQARDMALLGGEGGAFQQAAGVTFGGPIVAALGQGLCPGCKGDTVNASFDPRRSGGSGTDKEKSEGQILQDARLCFTQATARLVMRMRSEHQNFTEDEKFSYQFDTACQLLAQKHNISLSEASGYIEKTISQLR